MVVQKFRRKFTQWGQIFRFFSGCGLIDLLGGFFEFVVADLSVVIEVGAFDALKKNET